MDRWKTIWNRRGGTVKTDTFEETVLRLKELNGFDVLEDSVSVSSWLSHMRELKKRFPEAVSYYEAGCGSGANLVILQHEGVDCFGGIDYSEPLGVIAKQVTDSQDIFSGEALYMQLDPFYDVVFCDSVSQYFTSMDYAVRVFERMISKAEMGLAVMDVHDLEKRDVYFENRRSVIPDYETRYTDLDEKKLFLDRSVFLSLAEEYHMNVEITTEHIDGYWNDGFTYDVYLTRRS